MKRLFITLTAVGVYSLTAQTTISFNNIAKVSGDINSEAEEIMPMVSEDGKEFYFVRANHKNNVGGAKTGHDIWMSDRNGTSFANVSNKLKGLNNTGNNAVVGIRKGGGELYVLNAYKKETNQHQGIAKSKKDGKRWSDPEYVEVPGMNHDTDFFGYYVDPEETVMFISMHAPDAKGKEDIYVSVKEASGWSAPKNLGDKINTTGFEMSPYLSHDKKRLYFSSNGHSGQGSADIFYCEKAGDDWLSWGAPVNLGSEVNSDGFDAYFIEGPDSVAYFASNRGDFHSDLYTLNVHIAEIPDEPLLEEPLVEEPPAKVDPPVVEPVVEKPTPKPVPTVGNVYFDVNKSAIRSDAKSSLDDLARIMKDDPSLDLEVAAHTDITHTSESNMALSKRRAKSVKKYLVGKGIDHTRITTRAYGETQPKVACDECNEQIHQTNRRAEFKLFREI